MAKIGDTINVETKPVKISKNRFVMECFLTNKTSGSLIAKGSISFVPAIGLDLSKNLPFDNNTQN